VSDEPVGLLLTAEQIRARVAELGADLTRDYEGLDPVLIGVLKGSLVFMADLARAIKCPVTVDFMSITSYGDGSNSGVVRILKDLDESITERHVVLVEDIIDTGLTLTYLLATLSARRPASLEVCGLLDKSARRIVEVPIRYKGFDIPDEFVIGYGLDHEGRYRNLRSIFGVSNMAALRDHEGVARVLESAGA
jgi:hypoxanthine phosphoribosyltransferase